MNLQEIRARCDAATNPPWIDVDILDVEVQNTVAVLQDLWANTTGLDWAPSDALLRQMLVKYSAEIVGEALLDVGPKVSERYLTGRRWINYLWVVARNIAQRAGDAEADG